MHGDQEVNWCLGPPNVLAGISILEKSDTERTQEEEKDIQVSLNFRTHILAKKKTNKKKQPQL